MYLTRTHFANSSTALSPWQAKAAPKMLRSYLFNGYRRLSAEALFFLVPFGAGTSTHSIHHVLVCKHLPAGYGIYSWAKSYDDWQNSKAGHIAAAHH